MCRMSTEQTGKLLRRVLLRALANRLRRMTGFVILSEAKNLKAVMHSMYHKDSPINRPDDPIRVSAGQPLNYADMIDYIRSWPDKLVSFVAERLCDDDIHAFTNELYGYICVSDHDGPAFEEWRCS